MLYSGTDKQLCKYILICILLLQSFLLGRKLLSYVTSRQILIQANFQPGKLSDLPVKAAVVFDGFPRLFRKFSRQIFDELVP